MNKNLVYYPLDRKHYIYKDIMLSALYNDTVYDLIIDSNYNGCLLSDAPINEFSERNKKGYYETRVNLDDLSDIIRDRLYAEYKNRVFPVGYVAEGFAEIDLINEEPYVDVSDLDFKFSPFYHGGYLTIKKEEVSRLLADRKSILTEILDKKKEVIKGKTL